MHVIFKGALKQGVQWEMLVRNPAPKAPGFKPKPWRPMTLRRLPN
jgi:hypothetical protein